MKHDLHYMNARTQNFKLQSMATTQKCQWHPKHEYSNMFTKKKKKRLGGSSFDASEVDTWEYRYGFDGLSWVENI